MPLVMSQVYDALWDTVAPAAKAAAPNGKLTTSRRLRHWDNVSPNEMPILMMSQTRITADVQRRGAPTVWTLRANLAIYVHNSDQKSSPGILLVPLVDAVKTSMVPLPPPPAGNGMNNLGLPDMVEHAAIEGDIETDEGLLGDIAVALIPIKILCKPSF